MISEPALRAEGQVVLADLIALGQVGIVVLLAVPLGERRDRAVEGQARLEGQLERVAVHHGQAAGQAQADRTRLHVRLRRVEAVAAAAEELRLREKLDVDFQADDRRVIHVPARSDGRFVCHGVCRSNMRAARSSVSSANGGPRS